MTPVDRIEFAHGLSDLAAAYRGRVMAANELDAYWSALESYPLDWLIAGMRAAPILHPRFMPSAGELVMAAQHAETESKRKTLVTPAMADAIANGEHVCTLCEDTGWASEERMSRFGELRRYSTRCDCRETNHIYQAKMARERVSATRSQGER